jgi:heptosyltransferase-2
MNILILKLNATGDVVRTTTLLRRLQGSVTWVTAQNNVALLDGLMPNLRCVSWENRLKVNDREYDLVVSLEDDLAPAAFVSDLRHKQLFGSYLNREGQVKYTKDARRWFDLSVISEFGRQRADELKYLNRHTYQELIFDGLGFRFTGEAYVLPEPAEGPLTGDVAIAPVAGPVWPMKNWAYYDQLKVRLEDAGLRVNILPRRSSLLEHIGDVKQHRVLVSGDSLPMHLALGVSTPCVTVFSCTSPWEIHDYGLQTKIISPLLHEFFYKRGSDPRATTAIGLELVLRVVNDKLAGRACPAEIVAQSEPGQRL